MLRYIVVLSDEDPVARAVAERWGTPPTLFGTASGAHVRAVADGVGALRRPQLHVRDDHLDRDLPAELRAAEVPLVFPSIHRSESGTECLTVHPLGNLGDAAEVGGAPRLLVPAPARLLTATLRAFAEAGERAGLPATFEATHHGPVLELPAFFAEIGYSGPDPPTNAVSVLAECLVGLDASPGDRIAVGAGGGHYAPHFTDLAVKRRWAFGHLVPRHHLEAWTVRAALAATPGVEGLLYARAADAGTPGLRELGVRLRESEAPSRRGSTAGRSDASPPSGT